MVVANHIEVGDRGQMSEEVEGCHRAGALQVPECRLQGASEGLSSPINLFLCPLRSSGLTYGIGSLFEVAA